jgi:hypothetical protein
MKRRVVVAVAVVAVVAVAAALALSRQTREHFAVADKQRSMLDGFALSIGSMIMTDVNDENSFLHPTTGKAAFEQLLIRYKFPRSAAAIADKIWAPLRTYILNAPFDTGKTLDFVSLRAKLVVLLDGMALDEDIPDAALAEASSAYVMLRDSPANAVVLARANAILCAKANATTYDAFQTAFAALMKKVDPVLSAGSDVVEVYSSYFVWSMAQAVTRADLPNGYDQKAGLAAALGLHASMERFAGNMVPMDKIKSDCSVVHCCQQIDDPTNKWTDCNPCIKSVMMCQNLSSKDTCDASSKYCTWNATDNVCKSKRGVLYGEDSTTCSATVHVCLNNAAAGAASAGVGGGGGGGSGGGGRMVITLDGETKKADDKKKEETDKAAADKAAADKAAADKAAADKAAADKKKFMIAGIVLLGVLVLFAVIAILYYAFKDREPAGDVAPVPTI